MPEGFQLPTVANGQRAQDGWVQASSFEDIDAQAAHFRGTASIMSN